MPRRTPIQLALLAVGLLAWAYGQRSDDSRLTYVGLAFFAAAFVLRFLKPRDPPATP
jgi:hypothetical protein